VRKGHRGGIAIRGRAGGRTVLDDDHSRKTIRLRKSRIAKPILMIGLLLLIIGVSGILWLSLPENGTAILTQDTFVRLDGRLFGHISGSVSVYECLIDVHISFSVLDQHNWDVAMGTSSDWRLENIVDAYSSSGDLTEFSAYLPASEAYYLYVSSVYPEPGQPYVDGIGDIRVEVHWNIWGPAIDYFLEYSACLLLGEAFILYGYYAGKNRFDGAIYGGRKTV
jgi:hypothetical protein